MLNDASVNLGLKMRVEVIPTPMYVNMATLTGPFQSVSIPIIKLTAQTGMVVCSDHQNRANASEKDAEGDVDAVSIQNIINTGSLGRGMTASGLRKYERSPYLHKRLTELQPSAPPLESADGGSEGDSAKKEASKETGDTDNHLAMFDVQMATHRFVMI